MYFIFMLTRADQTVANCLELVDQVKSVGLKHIGFKDVGMSTDTLAQLNTQIQNQGAKSYLEIVDLTPEGNERAARLAIKLGVDVLLGGVHVDHILPILKGSGIKYYPYVGKPYGHPAKLAGNPAQIRSDCEQALAKGCSGVVLLAYRCDESQPRQLIQAARQTLQQHQLIVAGSVSSTETVNDLAELGVNGFTVGTAVMDKEFISSKGPISEQLEAILQACQA